MKVDRITTILKNIRKKYTDIHQMTETLDIDSDAEICRKLIEKRNRLLCEIMAEQRRLDKTCKEWRHQCAINTGLKKIYREIGSLISTVIALDTLIQQKFRQRIEDVKAEIYNFTKTSKMALSYARNNAIFIGTRL